MPDSLHDSINSILREKNLKQKQQLENGRSRRNSVLSKVYFRLLLGRILSRLRSFKVIRLLVIILIMAILVLKNSNVLYYKSLQVMDPIKITENYKLFNDGMDSCFKSQTLSYQDGAESRYFFRKKKVLHMTPPYEILTYEDLQGKALEDASRRLFANQTNSVEKRLAYEDNVNVINNQGTILMAVTFQKDRSTANNFKTAFTKLDQLNFDRNKVTLAVLFKSADKKDKSIETFMDNYYKLDSNEDAKFGKVNLIYLYEEPQDHHSQLVEHATVITEPTDINPSIADNHANFLVNNALSTERFIVYLPEWKYFDSKALNRIKSYTDNPPPDSKAIVVGYESSGLETVIKYVLIKSSLFKQGIQFNNVMLKGNSWQHRELVKTKNEEVENLCYQAEAIGHGCEFIETN